MQTQIKCLSKGSTRYRIEKLLFLVRTDMGSCHKHRTTKSLNPLSRCKPQTLPHCFQISLPLSCSKFFCEPGHKF